MSASRSARRRRCSTARSSASARSSRIRRRLLRREPERHRVHAIALAGRRLRRVGKDVAEMRAAFFAAHLDAQHPVAAIFDALDRLRARRFEEAGPAAVRLELGLAAEELIAAGAAGVDADTMLAEQLAAAGALGAGAAQDRVLLGRELLFPLLVALLHRVALFVHGGNPTADTGDASSCP